MFVFILTQIHVVKKMEFTRKVIKNIYLRQFKLSQKLQIPKALGISVHASSYACKQDEREQYKIYPTPLMINL